MLINLSARIILLLGGMFVVTLATGQINASIWNTVAVDNFVVDKQKVSFTVNRVRLSVIEGADIHSAKPLAARGSITRYSRISL